MPYMAPVGPDFEKVHNEMLLKMTEGFAQVAASEKPRRRAKPATPGRTKRSAAKRADCHDGYDRKADKEGS
jgi:hypothetical protein